MELNTISGGRRDQTNIQEKLTFSVDRISRLYVIPVVFFRSLPSFLVGLVTRKRLILLHFISLFSQDIRIVGCSYLAIYFIIDHSIFCKVLNITG